MRAHSKSISATGNGHRRGRRARVSRALRRLRRALRSVQGFTLIELMVTVVILGILAGLSMSVVDAKDAAYLATVKSDMRNLIGAQEGYFADNGEYAMMGQLPFDPSPDVQVVNVAAKKHSWSAWAKHKKRTDVRCAIFIGNANPIFSPAVEEGVMACEPQGGGGGGGAGGGGKGGGKGKGG